MRKVYKGESHGQRHVRGLPNFMEDAVRELEDALWTPAPVRMELESKVGVASHSVTEEREDGISVSRLSFLLNPYPALSTREQFILNSYISSGRRQES